MFRIFNIAFSNLLCVNLIQNYVFNAVICIYFIRICFGLFQNNGKRGWGDRCWLKWKLHWKKCSFECERIRQRWFKLSWELEEIVNEFHGIEKRWARILFWNLHIKFPMLWFFRRKPKMPMQLFRLPTSDVSTEVVFWSNFKKMSKFWFNS